MLAAHYGQLNTGNATGTFKKGDMLPGLKSKLEAACVVVLIASGLLHAGLFLVMDRDWDDPLSFRKATLFGLSTGVTLWSCLWANSYLQLSKYDDQLRRTLCVTLVLEVFLITLQTWRKELSHFNHSGPLNGLIELAMLLLISIAVLAIFQITYRSWSRNILHAPSNAIAWAIRWGMLLLCLSALAGYAITWIGQYQLAQGLSPTHWKTRGVLKFPHGAALHAIQTLALVAWLADRFKIHQGARIIHSLAAAHVCWLLYALHQTFAGLDRFEFDSGSLTLLVATILCAVASIIPVIRQQTAHR